MGLGVIFIGPPCTIPEPNIRALGIATDIVRKPRGGIRIKTQTPVLKRHAHGTNVTFRERVLNLGVHETECGP